MMASSTVSSTSDLDSSVVTTSIVSYATSPRVRQRRQVAWAENCIAEQPSALNGGVSGNFNSEFDDNQDGGSETLAVEELDRSPSAIRRRRDKRRRRRRRQQQQQIPETDDDMNVDVSSQLMSRDEVRPIFCIDFIVAILSEFE